MAKNYAFDLINESYNLSVLINKALRPLYDDICNRNAVLQLIKSSSSVCANITESQNSDSRKDLARYYRIALKSCRESLLWMRYLRDTSLINTEKLMSYQPKMEEIRRISTACLIKLKQ